jgi:archaellum component FlaC
MVDSRKGGAMAATDDLDVRVQRVESKIDALGVSVDEMSAEHRDHTTFAVERLAMELRARFHGVDARFDGVDARFDRVDGRLERLEAKFDAVQERIDSVDARFGTVLARFDGSDARLETMDVRFTRLERKVDRILDHLLPGATADPRRRP